MLELRPKHASEFQAKLVIHAIKTPFELKAGSVRRKLLVKPTIHRGNVKNFETNTPSTFVRDVEEAFFTTADGSEDNQDKLDICILRCVSFMHANAVANQMTQCLVLEVSMTPKVYIQKDHEVFLDNLKKRFQNERVSRNFY